MSIIKILQQKGYDTVPADFYSMIDVWKSWYDGYVKDFHTYQEYNGMENVTCHRYTLGMGKKVAEDWANLLMNEKVKITLEGEKEQAFFDDVCRSNNFEVKANEMQEMKSGLGTVAYVARVTGVTVKEDTGEIVSSAGGKIKLDYVTAPYIFPLSWENGYVKECAFASNVAAKNEKYIYLQIHSIGNNGNYIIENSIYHNNNGGMTKASFADVPGYENIPPVVNTGSQNRQFVIDRLNIANNYDYTLPMGIPAFANAIDQLKAIDEVYSDYIKEFEAGKLKVMFQPAATQTIDGEPTVRRNETYFYVLPEDTKDGNIIQPITVELRASSFNTGLQDMLNALSSRCGFGENHYRFDNGSIATATQVISENSTMFRTIKKHEIILESVLTELARIILRLGNSVLGMGLDENVEISIDFDDSIIEDKQAEFARDMQLLSEGIMNNWEFRMKWMNEDEETAKAALPKMVDLVTEGQNEVE